MSLRCPECGAVADTKETRKTQGAIRRRRECFNGHRFTTYEIHAEEYLRKQHEPLPSPEPRQHQGDSD